MRVQTAMVFVLITEKKLFEVKSMSKLKEEPSSPLQIIRTETVLSKLPIHSLSKKKRVNIKITKKNERGELELYWEVSHNNKYGPPGQLAYKIDTLVINRI